MAIVSEKPWTDEASVVAYVDTHKKVLAKPGNLEFINSLCHQYKEKGYLSQKQWFWVHKYAERIYAVSGNAPKTGSTPAPKTGYNFKTLVDRLRTASLNKEVSLKLRLEGVLGSPIIRFTFTGKGAQYPGTVNLVDVTNDQFIGRIHVTGNLELHPATYKMTPAFKEALHTLLDSLTNNFDALVKNEGLQTGKCACCGVKLKDGLEAEVGIGAQCAGNYSIAVPTGPHLKKTTIPDPKEVVPQEVSFNVTPPEGGPVKGPVLQEYEHLIKYDHASLGVILHPNKVTQKTPTSITVEVPTQVLDQVPVGGLFSVEGAVYKHMAMIAAVGKPGYVLVRGAYMGTHPTPSGYKAWDEAQTLREKIQEEVPVDPFEDIEKSIESGRTLGLLSKLNLDKK